MFDQHSATETHVRKPWTTRFVLWLLQSIPTAIVLTLLAWVGWWGHHSNWKVGKASELLGKSPSAATPAAAEWCVEHKVAEAECVLCGEADGKLPKRTWHGWCKVHGIAECPFENPDVVQIDQPPVITDAQRQAAALAIATRPRTKNNSICKLHQRVIQLASLEAQQKSGIETELVREEPVVEFISASGEITFDPARVAHLSSRLPGTIWRVDQTLGSQVDAGDLLLFVDSTDVGKAKTDLMQALAELSLAQRNRDRINELASKGSASERSVRETEATVREAEIRLLNARQVLANLGLSVEIDKLTSGSPQVVAKQLQFLGVPSTLRSSVSAVTDSSNLLPLLSPISGTVIEQDAVRGEVVATSDRLLTIADTSLLWLLLNAPQEEVRYLKLGQKVLFRPDASTDEIQATVTWISPSVDEKTRTVQVRAEIANPDGRLRSSAFGAGRIVLREQPVAVVVPNDALHWEGDCHVVFVRDRDYLKEGSPKLFHVRKVRPGVKSEQGTEIIAGLMPGEVVATKGSEALRATLLSANFGEGCCGQHGAQGHGGGGHHHEH
jgi:cobalt-zinc-cadmium efflux system membrane fusion protein